MENVVIIGSGPAGHTAAIYTARANLSPLMYEGRMAGGVAPGGQLTTTSVVENFPGFPTGIDGTQLMMNMREQSVHNGVRIETKTVQSVDLSQRPFTLTVDNTQIQAKSIIIATGATAKRLGAPGEERLWQRGISACAVCDGGLPIFRNKPIVVVGGGDVAMEEAMHLSHFGSQVYVIVRRDVLRASQAMIEKAQKISNISFIRNSQIQEIYGETSVEGVKVHNSLTNEITDLPCAGVFYAIGHTPNTAFLDGQVACDETGYILTTPGSTATSVAGVFAAGDVQDKKFRQAITSAGSGCMAALESQAWLSTDPT